MGVMLEIREGPMAGKVIGLKTGESVTVGRAAGRAQFALPHDTFMSGVHFAVECGPSGCWVQDRKSSNGTFLNGACISEAMLANGDEIKSGQTIFAVKMVADTKLASLLPPQEVAPFQTPQKPPENPSVSPVVEGRKPAPDAIAPQGARQPRPHAAESASDPASQPPGAELFAPQLGSPAAKSSPPATRPAPSKDAPEPPPGGDAPYAAPPAAAIAERTPSERRPDAGAPPSGGPPAAETPSPVMRRADLDEVAGESVKSAPPPVPEPPRFRAIPTPPPAAPSPSDAGAKARRGGENPPVVGGPRPRSAGPPPGVAPYIAEKFAERPAARAGGGPRGAAFSVMGWSFPAAPAEWQVQDGFGLQQSGHEEFPSSVAATEELLGGITLQQFVESQISMLRGYLRDPKIEPTMPPRVGGADESMAVDVRHSTKDGRELVYRRIYARSGASVGVLTVTTLAADFPQVLQSLQPMLDGAAFRSTVN